MAFTRVAILHQGRGKFVVSENACFQQSSPVSTCLRDNALIYCSAKDAMIDKLYERIGGRRTISAATECFYKKVLEDDSLRHFFGGTDMVHLRSRQVMFISMLLGGGEYSGKDIRSAHALARDHGLNDAHFDTFLKHFRAALEEVGVQPENAEEVVKLVENKRRTVLDP